MSDDGVMSVTIMGRSYSVKCSMDERASLQEAAAHVNNQMEMVRQSGTMSHVERVAVVTALNLAHELIQIKNQKSEYVDDVRKRVCGLQNKIENFLAAEEEVAV